MPLRDAHSAVSDIAPAVDRGEPLETEVAVVGAGFSGIGMAIALRKAGRNFLVLEKAGEVGGTWRENIYPGCACDVNSHLYSYSFSPNPHWTRMFSQQPEILSYLKDTVDKLGLRASIRFNAEVQRMEWSEQAKRWILTLADGATVVARVVVSGTGGLHVPSYAAVAGRERFRNPSFHSAEWRDDVALIGKRVAIVGTGASAIQIVPEIVDNVSALTLYQRTPPWVVAKPDRPTRNWERWLFRRVPVVQRLLRGWIWSTDDLRATAFGGNGALLKVAEASARKQIARQIADPILRRKVTPAFRLGCKRVLISNDYYSALTKPNVEVVTDPIVTVTETGIQTGAGSRDHDVIIYCTGFQPWAQTAEIVGRNGVRLADAWAGSPQAYLGLASTGFPNMFFLMGPNTALGSGSIIYMIESQIGYIMEALAKMDHSRIDAVEIRPEVQRAFDDDLQARIGRSVWKSGCSSWYQSKDGRNGAIWPGTSGQYRRRTRNVDLAQYRHG